MSLKAKDPYAPGEITTVFASGHRISTIVHRRKPEPHWLDRPSHPSFWVAIWVVTVVALVVFAAVVAL